jgi:hypothetical protein
MTYDKISFDKSFQITSHICATLVSPISVSVSVPDSVSVTFKSVESPFFVITHTWTGDLAALFCSVTIILQFHLNRMSLRKTNEVLV